MSVDVHRINAAAGFQTPTDAQYPTVPWFGELLACQACPARQEARRVVPGAGPLTAEIAIIGQNPGEEEDQTGVPFVGRGGEELNVWLRLLGIKRERVLVTNILHCHTTGNRPPTPKEIQTCESRWWAKELAAFDRLKVLIPLGRPALLGLVGKVTPLPDVLEPWWMKAGLGERELVIIPLAHPAYLLRTPGARPTLYDRVLPVVRDYMRKEAADVYQRAAL